MASAIADILRDMRSNPAGISFANALQVAGHFFGGPRNSGSHHVLRTQWPGNPRVNLQKAEDNKAKAHQIRQLLQTIEKLEGLQQRKGPENA